MSEDTTNALLTSAVDERDRRIPCRPYRSDGDCERDVVTVMVHWGRHVNKLTDTQLPSLYVASSLVHDLRSSCNVWTLDDSFLDKEGGENQSVICHDKYSAFATTRVQSASTTHVWNEMLTIAIPLDWKESTGLTCGLQLDVIERGPSQMEDFVCASVTLSLRDLPMDKSQVRVAAEFPCPTQENSKDTPTLYCSIRAFKKVLPDQQRCEVVLDRFAPIDTQQQLGWQHPVAAIMSEKDVSLLQVEGKDLESEFFDKLPSCYQRQRHLHRKARLRVLAPVGSSVIMLGKEHIAWRFPATLELKEDERLEDLVLIMFYLQDGVLRYAGHGRATVSGQDLKSDTKTTISVDVCDHSTVESKLLGHFSLDVRWWKSQQAWTSFFDTRTTRSIELGTAQTRRRLRAPTCFAWMDAFRRGLNRDPVTCMYDQGGPACIVFSLVDESVVAVAPSSNVSSVPLEETSTPVEAFISPADEVDSKENREDSGQVEAVGNNKLEDEWKTLTSKAKDWDLEKETLIVDRDHLLISLKSLEEERDNLKTIENVLKTKINGLEMDSAKVRANVDDLVVQLRAKQEDVVHLESEGKQRLDAIKSCGEKIVLLQKELKEKEEELAHVSKENERYVQQEKQQLQLILDGKDGFDEGNVHSERRLSLVVSQYKDLEYKAKTTQYKLDNAVKALEACRDLESKYRELEQAHVARSALLQRLQRENQEIGPLKKTVQLQEDVLKQFEEMVAHGGQVPPSKQDARASSISASQRRRTLVDQSPTTRASTGEESRDAHRFKVRWPKKSVRPEF